MGDQNVAYWKPYVKAPLSGRYIIWGMTKDWNKRIWAGIAQYKIFVFSNFLAGNVDPHKE